MPPAIGGIKLVYSLVFRTVEAYIAVDTGHHQLGGGLVCNSS